jgi:hypothetical protein
MEINAWSCFSCQCMTVDVRITNDLVVNIWSYPQSGWSPIKVFISYIHCACRWGICSNVSARFFLVHQTIWILGREFSPIIVCSNCNLNSALMKSRESIIWAASWHFQSFLFLHLMNNLYFTFKDLLAVEEWHLFGVFHLLWISAYLTICSK